MDRKTPRKLDRWDFLAIAIIFAVALGIRLIFALQILPLLIRNDELGTISAITLLYPTDWSEVTVMTGYYGGGFTILFAPLFHYLKDPVQIYHIILAILCAVQAAVVWPVYAIIKKHFMIDNRIFTAILALAACFMITRRSNNITNETPLYLLTWVIFYLILELIRIEGDRKKKRILSVILAVFYAYAPSVHERALAFFGMFAVLFLFYLYVYRKCLVSVPFFAVPFAAGYVASRYFKKVLMLTNFAAETKNVRNTSVTGKVSNLLLLKNPGNWKAFLFSFVGSYTTASLVTFSLIVVGTIITVIFIVKGLRRSASLTQNDETRMETYFFAGFIFFFSGIFAILLTQTAGWLPRFEAALEGGWHQADYYLKIIAYIRYYGMYLGPAVVLAVLYLYYHRSHATKLAFLSMLVSTALSVFWLRYIYRYISHCESALESWYPFGGKYFSEASGYRSFFIGAFLLVLVAIVLLLLVREKKYNVILVIICAFFIYRYVGLSHDLDLKNSKDNLSCIRTYQACEEQGIVPLAKEIYTTRTLATRYQFLFFDSHIHPYLPDFDQEEGIVISGSLNAFEEALDHGWMLADLGTEKKHYLFVKGEDTIRAFEAAGVSLDSSKPKNNYYYPQDFSLLTEDADVIQTGNFNLSGGTYQLSVDGTVSVDVLDRDGNILCRSAGEKQTGLVQEPVPASSEEESEYREISATGFTLMGQTSVHLAISLSESLFDGIELTNDEIQNKLEQGLSEIIITQVQNEYVFGMDHQDELKDVIKRIKKDQKFGKLDYCYNMDPSNIDMSYLDGEIAQVTVGICNEEEARQKDGCYLLMNASDDYLSLADLYKPVLINKLYVLMEKREKPGDGFVDISKLIDEKKDVELNLPAGLFILRFDGIDPQYLDGKMPLGYRIIAVATGKTLTRGLISEGEEKKASVYLARAQENLKIVLTYGEKEISCETVEIAMPLSAFESYWDAALSGVFAQIGQTGYAGEVLLFKENVSFSNDLLKKRAGQESGGLTVDVLSSDSLDVYDPEASGIGLQWLILPNDPANVLPLMPEEIVVSANDGYVLLVPETAENRSLLEKAGLTTLSQDGVLSAQYYIDDAGLEKPVSVPRGTYRFTVAVAEDAKDIEKVSLYRQVDQTEIVTAERNGKQTVELTAGALFIMPNVTAGPGADESGKMPRKTEEEQEKYKIVSVERLSNDLIFNLSDCELKGNAFYDPGLNAICGTDSASIRSSIFRIYLNYTFRVTATVKGKLKSAELASHDVGYLNDIVNNRSIKNNIIPLGEDRYQIFLDLSPLTTRFTNQIWLNAVFDGAYEIQELRIEHT